MNDVPPPSEDPRRPPPPSEDTLRGTKARLFPEPPAREPFDGIDAALNRIERTLSDGERITLHRAGRGRWMASWFDPQTPPPGAYFSADEDTPQGALKALAAKIGA